MNKRVLIIDDDTNLLSGLRRQLHGPFEVETASSGGQALALVESSEPFAVVLCDMRMPGLNGVQTLSRIRTASPDTVRMMLTGNIDQQTAVDAVNDGNVFRFLNKPVPTQKMRHALEAGVEQYRLITAERELLSQTVAGSVKVLTDILSLVNPPAFARTSRVRRLAGELGERLEIEHAWELELAASLSLIGCVAVHGAASHKSMPDDFRQAQISHDLIAQIPRLETVAQIVADQNRLFSEENGVSSGRSAESVPFAARILKVALDYDELTESGSQPQTALCQMKSRSGWYEPQVVEALEDYAGIEVPPAVRSVPPHIIPENAILAEDVMTQDGTLLLSKGQEISRTLRLRLINYLSNGQIGDQIKINTSPVGEVVWSGK